MKINVTILFHHSTLVFCLLGVREYKGRLHYVLNTKVIKFGKGVN